MSTLPLPDELIQAPRLALRGLLPITDQAEASLLTGFSALSTSPGAPDAAAATEATDTHPMPNNADIFAVKSYYISKELLASLAAYDFADYEGLHISFGYNPATPGNGLVLILRGMYQQLSDDERSNFQHSSQGRAWATCGDPSGDPPAGGVVPIIRNPPFAATDQPGDNPGGEN